MNVECCTEFCDMKAHKKDPFQTGRCRVQKRTSFGTEKASTRFMVE